MNRAEYRADVLRYDGVGAALRTIISDVEHGWDRITRHQTTAAQAAAAPAPTEEHMNLTDVKNAAVNTDNWLRTMLGQHVPALIAEVERYQSMPIVQELEALGETMLPPGDVAIITGIIRMAGRAAGQSAPQQADVPETPAGQAPEGAQPAWQAQGTAPADANPSSDPRNR